MSIFDSGMVFTNHKEELLLNYNTETCRKHVKGLRMLSLFFFTFLTLSKKDNLNKIKFTSEVGTI